MNVRYHCFDRSHLRTLVPEKAEDFQLVLDQARRNPGRLNMLMMLAIDYAGCLAATNRDDGKIVSVLRVGAQAAAAVFTQAATPDGESAEVPLGDGPPVSYRRVQPLVSTDPSRWITGFYLAAITRDSNSKDRLCRVPTDLIRSSQVQVPAYFLPFVETLRALHLGSANADQHLDAAQKLLAREPFSMHEADVGINLYGPTLALCAFLVEDNYNGFQATLEKALELHHAYWEQDEDHRDRAAGVLPLGPLAMSCLARDRGVAITVSSDYLLPQLIERTAAE